MHSTREWIEDTRATEMIMVEPDAPLKSAICSFLVDNGLSVEEIPTAQVKTPDLHVNRDLRDAALIEIKTKDNDPQEMADLETKLKQGGVVGRQKSTYHWKRIDGIVGDGIRQFRSADPDRKLLRFLWFYCVGIDAELFKVRLKATLYGTRNLVSSGTRGLITCYYFEFSSFFKYREELDGVVISRGTEASLCLNNLSPRFDDARKSGFAKSFGTAVFWPGEEHGSKSLMIHDADIPRGDEALSLNHLREKYSLKHLQVMNMAFHMGMMRVDEKADQ